MMVALIETGVKTPLPGDGIFEDGQVPETYEQRTMLYQPVKTYQEWRRLAWRRLPS